MLGVTADRGRRTAPTAPLPSAVSPPALPPTTPAIPPPEISPRPTDPPLPPYTVEFTTTIATVNSGTCAAAVVSTVALLQTSSLRIPLPPNVESKYVRAVAPVPCGAPRGSPFRLAAAVRAPWPTRSSKLSS